MRCPDCSKFVSLEMGDPEDVNLDMSGEELDESGELTLLVSMTCRIVRNCAECGTELKEASLEVSDDEVMVERGFLEACTEQKKVDKKDTWVWKEGHGDMSIDETNVEQIEEGGGRYAKSYFGAQVSYEVKCKCGVQLHEGQVSDKVAASGMDELT